MIKIYAYSCLLSALSFVEMKPINITGHVGKSLTIECSDWNSWTDVTHNVKYICYSPCSEDKDVIIKAESGKTKTLNRIELTNSADGLFVTFTNLQMSDSKTYYCGAERYGYDSFIEVNLKVVNDTNSSTMSSRSSEIMTNMSMSYTTFKTTLSATQGAGNVPYLTAGVISIITIVMVVLILAFKRMKKQQAVVTSPQEDTVESAGCDGVYQTLNLQMMDENQVYSTLTQTQRSAGPEEVSQSVHPLMTDDQVYNTLTSTKRSEGPVEVSQLHHPLTMDEDPVYSTITPTKMSAVLESAEVDTSSGS